MSWKKSNSKILVHEHTHTHTKNTSARNVPSTNNRISGEWSCTQARARARAQVPGQVPAASHRICRRLSGRQLPPSQAVCSSAPTCFDPSPPHFPCHMGSSTTNGSCWRYLIVIAGYNNSSCGSYIIVIACLLVGRTITVPSVPRLRINAVIRRRQRLRLRLRLRW